MAINGGNTNKNAAGKQDFVWVKSNLFLPQIFMSVLDMKCQT